MSDKVTLGVPAKAEYAKTVRLTAASLAARAEMTFDEIEDVKLATEEAFVFVSDRAEPGASVDIGFEVDDGGIRIEVGPVAAAGEPEGEALERAEFARFILEAVCDDLEIEDRDRRCSVRLVKRTGTPGA